MKFIVFAKRNFKELVRDPMSIFFCVILPLVFLIIFQQFNIPSSVYSIENFAPSVVIFSFAFLSLFTGQLVSKDKSSSLLSRLFSSPMKISDYIIGYSLAFLPIAILQSVLFFVTAAFFDLTWTINTFFTILILIPISLLFIGLGILIGCLANERQAPAIGSIVVQFVTFTSGMWFEIDIMGKVFKTICNLLPFRYTIDLSRRTISSSYDELLIPFLVVILFTIIIYVLAALIFKKQMKK